jgi:hypothetical protein
MILTKLSKHRLFHAPNTCLVSMAHLELNISVSEVVLHHRDQRGSQKEIFFYNGVPCIYPLLHTQRVQLAPVYNSLPVACQIWLPVVGPSPLVVPRHWKGPTSRVRTQHATSMPGTSRVRTRHTTNKLLVVWSHTVCYQYFSFCNSKYSWNQRSAVHVIFHKTP